MGAGKIERNESACRKAIEDFRNTAPQESTWHARREIERAMCPGFYSDAAGDRYEVFGPVLDDAKADIELMFVAQARDSTGRILAIRLFTPDGFFAAYTRCEQ